MSVSCNTSVPALHAPPYRLLSRHPLSAVWQGRGDDGNKVWRQGLRRLGWGEVLSVDPCCFALRRFLYDGERISDDDTPASLGMEDNGACAVLWPIFSPGAQMLTDSNCTDTIDVMVERTCRSSGATHGAC